MAVKIIKTEDLSRVHTPQGDVTEILSEKLCGARNVHGLLRWLHSGEKFQAGDERKHQLVYVMEGQGTISIDHKDYEVRKGAGVYLGPGETAVIAASKSTSIKLFQLAVPQIPK